MRVDGVRAIFARACLGVLVPVALHAGQAALVPVEVS